MTYKPGSGDAISGEMMLLREGLFSLNSKEWREAQAAKK
jgi:hypothetical protein